MKTVFESVIRRGGYDLARMLERIDTYHIEGKLTDAQRDSLYTLARESADPAAGLDLMAKVLELEQRVKALEGSSVLPGEVPADFVPGKWYETGDRVLFEGSVYVCTAPDGVVCTWSPAEYPGFWEKEG